MDSNDLIKVERAEGICWIILNRPGSSNAFNTPMLEQLADALDGAIADDAVRAIILAGEGPNFQSGMDISSLAAVSSGEMDNAQIAETIYALPHRISKALRGCPKPTIAAMQGAVVTMGCEFSLLCDFRIVTPETYFEEKWVRMGVIPALGGLKLLPLLVGQAHAKRMILLGERVYGTEAQAIGLSTRCVASADLRAVAKQFAEELGALSASAFRKAKALMIAGESEPFEDILVNGANAQAELLTSEEFRSRLRR